MGSTTLLETLEPISFIPLGLVVAPGRFKVLTSPLPPQNNTPFPNLRLIARHLRLILHFFPLPFI